MLRILRKNAQSPAIQAIVVIIAVVFIFWGVGGNLNRNANAVATVDGQEITGVAFHRAYENLLERYKQQFGGQIPDELLNSMGIKQQAINQLVQQELVRKGAEQLGLMVSDPEVQRAIEAIPAFRNNGVFDLDAYKVVLEQNRLSPTSFEEGIRKDLLTERAKDAITGFAQVSEQEIKQWLDYANMEIKLAYAIFSRAELQKQVQVDETELADWYAQNKEHYRPAAQHKFDYLFFPFAAGTDQVQVSEEEKQAYFNEHAAQWHTPEQRHVRHILFHVPQDASAETRATKKEAAEKALEQLRGGSDFAELANNLSEDPAGKGKGGDLGMISQGEMVPEFDATAFSLASGAISEVVTSPFGYHLIKVESVNPAATPAFAEKEAEIAQILVQQKARSLAFKTASSAYEEVMRAGSLARYSESGAQKLASIDYVSQHAIPQDNVLLHDAAFAKAAFALGKGELSSIVEGQGGYAIFFAHDIKTLDIPPLEAVHVQVLADYTREKSAELVRTTAKNSLKSLQENNQWPQDVQVHTTAFIKRNDTDTDIAPALIQEAFSQLGKSNLPSAPLNLGEDYAVYQITSARQGEDTIPTSIRDSLQQQLLEAQRNQLFNNWVAQVQAKSKIWINPDIFK
ncbi:MAG: SurA N-terminal domain-containing protein [Desulfobulbus sp.]|jgi:peptidyl-prolyl cis-trans isomerase D